jgi:hypothetical protein
MGDAGIDKLIAGLDRSACASGRLSEITTTTRTNSATLAQDMLSDAQLMSSSPSRFPSSPSPSTGRYLPLSSSPLAPTKSSSPFARNQARRRSQYQSRVANTPKIGRPAFSPYTASSGSVIHGFSFAEDPQKAFLRERFKAQCFQRAVDARERVVRGRRWKKGEPSSDGLEMECEGMDEEGDEDVMQDEVR